MPDNVRSVAESRALVREIGLYLGPPLAQAIQRWGPIDVGFFLIGVAVDAIMSKPHPNEGDFVAGAVLNAIHAVNARRAARARTE